MKVVLPDTKGKAWVLLVQTKFCPKVIAKNDNRFRYFSAEPADLFQKKLIPTKNKHFTLTPMEKKVAIHVNHGLTKDQIADALHISPYTLNSHYHNINVKLGFSDILQSCTFAEYLGLN